MKLASVQLDVVPFGIAEDQVTWIPSEPGLWSTDDPSASLKDTGETVPAVDRIRRETERELIDAMHVRLQQLLSFLDERTIDICVFPEYALPCDKETLILLHGFSERMTIVAGIGMPRNDGVELLKDYTDDSVDRLSNAAAVFSRKRLHLVCKSSNAKGEQSVDGAGPRVIDIETHDGPVKLGVSICKDYLLDPSGAGFPRVPDIVAIPALTRKTEPFDPGEPRDFVRIFANTAASGNSTIYASGIEGAFVERGNVRPIPRHSEGVIGIEWNGAHERPTGLLKQPNRVSLRAALLTHTDGSEGASIIREMESALKVEAPFPSNAGTIPRWLRFLEGVPRMALLRDAVETYRDALDDEVLSDKLAAVLTTHVQSTNTPTIEAIRRKALTSVSTTLDKTIGAGISDPSTYRQVLQAADSFADWRPGGGRQATTALGIDDVDGILHFQIGFGRFDIEKAVATIPEQEDLLASFFAGAPQGCRLSFVLRTTEDPATGAIGARFYLQFFGPNTPAAREYFRALEPVTRSVFVRGWSLYSDSAFESTGVCTEVRPSGDTSDSDHMPDAGAEGSQREDLGLLVDAACAAGGGVALEMLAERSKNAPEPSANTELGLRIRLFTPQTNVPLGDLVGSTLFPTGWATEAVDPLQSGKFTSMPIQSALKILHPPDGHIAGRGMSRDHQLEIAASYDSVFLGDGALLGSATVHHPAADKTIEVRIPDATRTLHTYVIGRTGSGKTNTLKNIVRHDLRSGNAVVVIDPHRDLFDYAVRHVVGRREFVSLDFSATSVPSINPLYLDAQNAADVMRNIDDLVEAMIKTTYHQFAGPRFRDIARLCLETLVAVADESQGRFATLADVPMLIEHRGYRDRQIAKLTRLGLEDLARRWSAHHRMPPGEQAEVEQWFVSKFSDFRRSAQFRRAVSGRPDISFISMLKQHCAVLIRVPTVGIGMGASEFLGSFIVERVLRYTMENGFNDLDQPASLIVDEFQTFVGTSFLRLIPEARKFNLAITIANQTLSQLSDFSQYEGVRSSEMEHIILGNVGNLIVHSLGHADAEKIGLELALPTRDLMRIGRFTAVGALTVRNIQSSPFTIDMENAGERPGVVSDSNLAAVIQDSVRRAREWVTIPNMERAEVDEAAEEDEDASADPRQGSSHFLDEWLKKRKTLRTNGPGDEVQDSSEDGDDGNDDKE